MKTMEMCQENTLEIQHKNQRIPKIIHYCWFGGNPLSELAQKCITSWQKFCPDYEIQRWDETNFPILDWDYAQEAYNAKKWAFVSDVARLWALVKFGGIYMDTDVEVIRPLDGLLFYDAVSGFETTEDVPTGLIACKKNHPFLQELLFEYENKHFYTINGGLDLTTNVKRITNTCVKYGLKRNNTLQTINGLTLLPKDYLCPKDYMSGKVDITIHTLTIHHFSASWVDGDLKKIKKLMPGIFAPYIAQFLMEMKHRGIGIALKKTFLWLKDQFIFRYKE